MGSIVKSTYSFLNLFLLAILFAVVFPISPAQAIVDGVLFNKPQVVQIRGPVSTCSGTLVGPNAVLTAAHCLYESGDVFQVTILGQNYVGRPVIPKYYSIHSHLDIGLLKLDQEVIGVEPWVIRSNIALGDRFYFFGYGCADLNSPLVQRIGLSSVLDFANGIIFSDQSKDSKICAGDSGGPAVLESLRDYSVVGLVSRANEARGHFIDLSAQGAQKFLKKAVQESGLKICGFESKDQESFCPQFKPNSCVLAAKKYFSSIDALKLCSNSKNTAPVECLRSAIKNWSLGYSSQVCKGARSEWASILCVQRAVSRNWSWEYAAKVCRGAPTPDGPIACVRSRPKLDWDFRAEMCSGATSKAPLECTDLIESSYNWTPLQSKLACLYAKKFDVPVKCILNKISENENSSFLPENEFSQALKTCNSKALPRE